MRAIRAVISLQVIVTLTLSGRSLDAANLLVPKDHQTIQAAIDAAAPGDTVLVSAGTYRERIRLKPGVTLRSDGDDARGDLGLKRAERTIINGTGGNEDFPGVMMAEDSTVDGFTVTGVGAYDDAAWNAHYATQGEDQSYDRIGKPGVAGIAVIGITNCEVANNIVHHVGYSGIITMGGEGKRVSAHIHHNIAYRNMGGGIGAMMHSSPTIESNTCFENFYAGIGHATQAYPLVINNVCYSNIRAGIGISEGSKPIVRGNKCYKNRRAGIGVRTGEETTPLIEHNECYDNDMAGIGAMKESAPIIRHNRCYRNAEAGIGCELHATPLVEFNECFENGMSGIGCRSNSAPVIRNNRCYRNKTSGIAAQDGAQPVIVGNECFENVMAGIGAEEEAQAIIRDNKCDRNLQAGIGIQNGAKGIVVDNECRENTESGIGIREKSTAYVIHNKCFENKLVAIGVRHESIVRIIDNELIRSGGMPPMIVIQENSKAVVAENVITGGGVAGVLVRGTATITGNQFNGNGPRKGGPPNFAAWAHPGSTLTFMDNDVDRWRHALSATDAESVRAIGNRTSQFLDTSIVVNNSKLPAHVSGNVAVSENESDEPVRVSGAQGMVDGNVRQAPETARANP